MTARTSHSFTWLCVGHVSARCGAGLLVAGVLAVCSSGTIRSFFGTTITRFPSCPSSRMSRRSWSEGHLPLLSPYSWVCSNLAGEFQYGTFSLFVNAAVVLIWKFPLSFAQQAAALSMAHLFVLGGRRFSPRARRALSTPLAMMVALVAALNGWIICWGATDWFGALGAFAWLPWAWWAMDRALDPAAHELAISLAGAFRLSARHGGFPYTVLMLALVAGWLAAEVVRPNAGGFRVTLAARARTGAWVRPLRAGLARALRLRARVRAAEQANPGAHWQWLLPPAALPGFVLPCVDGELVGFFGSPVPHAADRAGLRNGAAAGPLAALFYLRRAFVRRVKWELGSAPVVLPDCDAAERECLSLEFSLAAVAPSRARSVAAEALQHFRLRERSQLASAGFVFVCSLATYLFLPTNAAFRDILFAASLTSTGAARSGSALPQCLSATGICLPDRKSSCARRASDAAGKHFDVGGAAFLNGYSPIRGAGVGRSFAFSRPTAKSTRAWRNTCSARRRARRTG